MNLSSSNLQHTFPDIPGYRIVKQLYLGLRTAVYQAIKTTNQQHFVIKILRRDYPNFDELLKFRNQYTIAKNLPIPGIVQVLSLENLERGYALVMEDFGGISLDKYIHQQPLALMEVLNIALQLAIILHDLHQQRVIHKDIKPANILIDPESKQVKLIDFSIASLLPKETQEIHNPNILEGTLAYLAPEQTGRMNRGIDYRADYYALGVTLYQLLTNTLPFISTDPLEILHCHIAKTAQPVDRVNPSVPKIVGAIVAKLMAKNAEDRYQSALGLQHDLQQCLSQWEATGEIIEFELGERDLSDRFLIPEKLYGRENEVQTLLEAFDRVAEGAAELMLVAGFSGIGKTAVVNEVHKPIVRQKGYFIKGKFDQFNRNIPFSAFVQAFRDLMGQLLSETDEKLLQWRDQILQAVGENGQVLIEVIPELENIIGQQPPAPELSGTAAQNRFNLMFQKFIQVFTTLAHPLVIFLDDLQWADSASLQLLKLLMEDSGYLLILGAYRDNEVSPAHPFILMVEELKKVKAIVNTITLAPLAFVDTNRLIADTLKCSLEVAQSLTELVDRKTKGNPFFTTQFLKSLHEEGHIIFNCDRHYWECDIAQINTLALTDDVVEFMALQLQKLPPETQQVLKLAACVGNQFDLETLAIVSERSPTETATALWRALQEGLVLPTSQVYKFFQDTEQSEIQEIANPIYRFLHDRIQQAAYSLIPEQEKQATHYNIGKLLLDNSSDFQLEERLFEIVTHLNAGRNLIDQNLKPEKLAQLNLMAGNKALAATAYAAAMQYLTTGIELLAVDSWHTQYQLTLGLYIAATEAAYLSTEFEQVERLAEIVLQATNKLSDQIEIYEIKIQVFISQNKLGEALELGLKVLGLLGINCPVKPNQSDIMNELQKTQLLWDEFKVTELIDLPLMTDPNRLAAMQILLNISAVSYIANPPLYPLIVFQQVNLSVKYGNAAASTYAYAAYGLILCGVVGDVVLGYQFSRIALSLLHKLNAKELQSKIYVIVNCFIQHWHDHLRTTIQSLQDSYLIGLEIGDLEFAAYSAFKKTVHLYFAGEELSNVEEDITLFMEGVKKIKRSNILNYYQVVHQVVRKLRYSSKENINMDENRAILEIPENTQDPNGICYFYCHQMILYYLFGDNSRAIENANFAQNYLEAIIALFFVSIFYFYDSLIKLAVYGDAPLSEQESILVKVTENQQKMQTWADNAPMNHLHKFKLVEAEKCRVIGNKTEAIDLYDRAISGAKENGYIQEEALANELAAKFYLEWGKEKVAAGYMQDAYYCYARWGAKAKAQDLEQRYPQLLAPILQQQQMALSTTETVLATTFLVTSQATTQPSSAGSTSICATLDLATVLKASQALSREIQLDKLLATLLSIVLENAGADKGILLMPRKNQWFVEAVATIDQPAIVQSIALSDSLEMPQSLIHAVKRHLQPLVAAEATVDPNLATDPYVLQQQPKSLLCTPILNQGKLVAILYLENRVTAGVFTAHRLELLNFLCTQAAISLENARLYRQLQDYAQQLERSQLQMVQSEKMASLGNLVAGIAHEVNNPIGFLNASIDNAKNYVADLLDYLALYQKHHPNAAAPVQEKAEDIDWEYVCEDLPKLLNSMVSAVDRIKGISTSLRVFSRTDTEYKVQANLHEGIDSTLLILKYRLKANSNRPEIEVIRDYGQLPLVECFPGQLNQVFMNILANAIDMFDEMAQGRSFDELMVHPQQIRIGTTADDCQVQITIGDNGKGMSQELKSRIFDQGFTTKIVGKGTGLGLAIARQIIVEKHQGTISVNSEIGRGTEFAISLPTK